MTNSFCLGTNDKNLEKKFAKGCEFDADCVTLSLFFAWQKKIFDYNCFATLPQICRTNFYHLVIPLFLMYRNQSNGLGDIEIVQVRIVALVNSYNFKPNQVNLAQLNNNR